jgi:hypothetical protein
MASARRTAPRGPASGQLTACKSPRWPAPVTVFVAQRCLAPTPPRSHTTAAHDRWLPLPLPPLPGKPRPALIPRALANSASASSRSPRAPSAATPRTPRRWLRRCDARARTQRCQPRLASAARAHSSVAALARGDAALQRNLLALPWPGLTLPHARSFAGTHVDGAHGRLDAALVVVRGCSELQQDDKPPHQQQPDKPLAAAAAHVAGCNGARQNWCP